MTLVTTSIKDKARTIVLDGVGKKDLSVIRDLVAENYIQHNPMVADGRKGLEKLIAEIEYGEYAGKPAPTIDIKRVFQDGNFVILHSEFYWPNRKAVFEIFRFEDEVALEHWSGMMDHPETTVSGNGLLDGPTEIRDLDKTNENKTLVKAFVENVLIAGQFDKIADYYHKDIIQHNPYIDNTIDGLINGIQNLQEQGITLEVEKIHYTLGQGNFVLVLSEGKFNEKPTAFFDLFRVEKGKVAEHWDVRQEVPETMAHSNGMF